MFGQNIYLFVTNKFSQNEVYDTLYAPKKSAKVLKQLNEDKIEKKQKRPHVGGGESMLKFLQVSKLKETVIERLHVKKNDLLESCKNNL